MNSTDVRSKYIAFFAKHGHKEIPSAPLVPLNDPTTLFNSSGMQPLVPYLLGQPHPEGKRLVNSQKAIRLQDIDEVGDNRHTTFFEMLGNWSLGDYFKTTQLDYIWAFLTDKNEGIGLPKEKLYVSIFEGNAEIPRDEISYTKWLELGMPKDHIFEYDVKKNWWSRSGPPTEMPPGEPGGPSSEIFYEFTSVTHDPKFGKACHPNCDCGRFMEIGNNVFMQYKKLENGKLEELPNKNVDFGGGLERLVAATNNNPDVFESDLFLPLIKTLELFTRTEYGKDINIDVKYRIILDHIRAATFLVKEGIIPSNKLQGYVLRRIIRRASLKLFQLPRFQPQLLATLVSKTVGIYEKSGHFEKGDAVKLNGLIYEEVKKFDQTLKKGMREIEKIPALSGTLAFKLYETYGFPWEMTEEIARERGQKVEKGEFEEEFTKHKDVSRTAAKGLFKGGLADQSTETTRLHTAHHLLLAALQKIVDPTVKQRGSNITAERLRIDFSLDRKLTPEEIAQVEEFVNQKIQEGLPVQRIEMEKVTAERIGAQMEFGSKYPNLVSVYLIGLKPGVDPMRAKLNDFFSAEFCGGPHVANTTEIGEGGKKFKIQKEESVGSGVRRIKGILV